MKNTLLRALVCAVLCLTLTAGLFGCAKEPDPKTALTGAEFTAKMEALGYTVEDTTAGSINTGVVQVLTASRDGVSLQFYVADSPEAASKLYDIFAGLQKQAGETIESDETAGPNFSALSCVFSLPMALSGAPLAYYGRTVRVDATLLYVQTMSTNRAQVEQAAGEMGY